MLPGRCPRLQQGTEYEAEDVQWLRRSTVAHLYAEEILDNRAAENENMGTKVELSMMIVTEIIMTCSIET